MTTINFGDEDHAMASLTVSSDVVTFGDGQGDILLLNGDGNTATLGAGNQDMAAVGGTSNTVTLGDGDRDAATTMNGSFNQITLGNGNADTAIVSGGSHNTVTLGNGNQDSAVVNGGPDTTIRLGDGAGDTAAVSGNEENVYIGNGNADAVTVSALNTYIYAGNGQGDTLTINGDLDSVFGGQANVIRLANGGGTGILNLQGCSQPLLFMGSGTHAYLTACTPPGGSIRYAPTPAVGDQTIGMQLDLGPTIGSVALGDFGRDLAHGVIDLIGGIGGFATTGAVLAALAPDGSGGTLVPFGPGSALDIQAVAPSALTAANFRIG
jgi:hypothetical protein